MCTFCADKIKIIDYKDIARLRRYLSDRAKIEPRRKTGTCAKHQRMLTTALKRARHMAMLPYTADHVRDMMSPQQRAVVGGPPPERPPLRSAPPPPPAAAPQPPAAVAHPPVPQAEPVAPRPEPTART
jgi:small subunit ribosomal protein S18